MAVVVIMIIKKMSEDDGDKYNDGYYSNPSKRRTWNYITMALMATMI